ncbi:XamI family restriction endonuclease [Pseudomonas hunanensis]|uniref:XamI family restriction endonuclease n=1 Tax=Pseudomonas hunanensis TaxID=1247546 RepID=A0ACC9N212_9PSED|nr:XamI family restriction endonuclease [Pseudomonas hunanensis]PKF26836.1 XamI family restriction endonuclease [Pseudomonas hunanensis]
MIEPPVWSKEQLLEDSKKASAEFTKERLEEPLEDYLEAFDEYQGHIEEVLETTVDLSHLDGAALELLSEGHLLHAFRYLAAPPISQDDLKVLADAKSLTKATLKKSPELVDRLTSVVRQVLDRRRFSWVTEGREPTEAERYAAVVASAALMAASRTQTKRRNVGKEQQESRVKAALLELGFKEVPSRRILNISLAPDVGEFCGESMLGTRKGDIIVRLWDQRIMPIECKVSNSATNSVKRLNNDAAVKAVSWREDFGRRQVVPAAMLSGVYKIHNLIEAQDRGLTIFWAHDLNALVSWINKTKT